MRLLVSLHDVTPFHQVRLQRAERLFTELEVPEVSYLLVPDFHGCAPVELNPTFAGWCRRSRPFGVNWVLHGYYHREFPGDSRVSIGIGGHIRRWLLTDGEAEFLGLGREAISDRLTRGCEAFSAVVRTSPRAFVAPAWLVDSHVFSALLASGIRYTEDHFRVFDLVRGIDRCCPAITWSTRSAARRIASRSVTRTLVRRWRHEPALRVALHPCDFDHADVEESIRSVLGALLQRRTCGDYPDVFQDTADETAERPLPFPIRSDRVIDRFNQRDDRPVRVREAHDQEKTPNRQ